MSFFIRNKGSGGLNGMKKRKGGFVAHPSGGKQRRKKRVVAEEEVSSSEDEDEAPAEAWSGEEETEDLETPQERKLKLARKYLEEIEKEERARLEGEAEQQVEAGVLVRLREGVLEEAGRLRKEAGPSISRSLGEEDLITLRNKKLKSSVTCLVVCSDSSHVFSASKDGWILKWSLDERQVVGSIAPQHKSKQPLPHLHSSSVQALALSQDDAHLASSDLSNIIRVWDGQSLEYQFSLTGHRGRVTGLAFCRGSDQLYSCSADRTVRVWSVRDRAYIETLFGHQSPITSIDVLSQGRVVTSGGVDNSLRLWKIQDESQLVYNGKLRSVDCVRRLDEKHFVSCGEDGNVCLWGVSRKKPLCTVTSAHGLDIGRSGEPRWITCVAPVHNSEVFATGSCDGSVRVWCCGEGFKSVKLHLEVPAVGFVNAMAFTPDRKHLVIGLGQEHRLGRWSRNKDARNSLLLVKIASAQPGAT